MANLGMLDGARLLKGIANTGTFARDLFPPDVLALPTLGRAMVETLLIVAFIGLDVGAVLIGLTSYVPLFVQEVIGTGPLVAGFALATLTYEMLTGRLPGRVYVPATRYQSALAAELDSILGRALARDREERYSGVTEFARHLAAVLSPSQERILQPA